MALLRWVGFAQIGCLCPDGLALPRWVGFAQDLGNNFGDIFRQRFCNDLAFGERSGGISGSSLHIILLRIFLDGSGLRIEVRSGHLFAPKLGKRVSSCIPFCDKSREFPAAMPPATFFHNKWHMFIIKVGNSQRRGLRRQFFTQKIILV